MGANTGWSRLQALRGGALAIFAGAGRGEFPKKKYIQNYVDAGQRLVWKLVRNSSFLVFFLIYFFSFGIAFIMYEIIRTWNDFFISKYHRLS